MTQSGLFWHFPPLNEPPLTNVTCLPLRYTIIKPNILLGKATGTTYTTKIYTHHLLTSKRRMIANNIIHRNTNWKGYTSFNVFTIDLYLLFGGFMSRNAV
jgi:hypothetical protein